MLPRSVLPTLIEKSAQTAEHPCKSQEQPDDAGWQRSPRTVLHRPQCSLGLWSWSRNNLISQLIAADFKPGSPAALPFVVVSANSCDQVGIITFDSLEFFKRIKKLRLPRSFRLA